MDEEKSHWGWGRADRFMDREGRENLGAVIGAKMGFQPSALEDPVPLEAVELPPARIEAPAGLPWITDAPEPRIRRTYGRSYLDQVRGFRGDFTPAPDLVARPKDENELERTLEWASGHPCRVVPYGGGTSVVGGVTVDETDRPPVVTVDLGSMGGLLELDELSRLARIAAGTPGPALERALAERGLTLRFFPQSFELSTLGGWVATRAGGHFATGPTHIDELVAGTRTLTPTGWMTSWPLPGSGAGPSPDRGVLGSEGQLGVITEATVRVRPRPTFRAKADVRFAGFADAATAARHIVQSGLQPANCRVLDEREAGLYQVVDDGSAVLLLGFESAAFPQDDLLEKALGIALDAGGRCPDGPQSVGEVRTQGSGETWRSAFVDMPYVQPNLISLGVLVDTFETACTWTSFASLHAELVAEVRGVMKAETGHGRLSCRFTHVYPDGPAPYYTFMCPVRPGQERELWPRIKSAAAEVLVRHQATITHHHAVGRTHAPWYQRQAPERWQAALQGAKRAVDPKGLMPSLGGDRPQK